MCDKKHDRCRDNEVFVGNTLFRYDLNQVNETTVDLIATPCNVPTSVYCIARINTRENCCNNMIYYQAFINTDPVQIIQDCNLCDIITRAIELYFENTPVVTNNINNRCCNRNIFGLF